MVPVGTVGWTRVKGPEEGGSRKYPPVNKVHRELV